MLTNDIGHPSNDDDSRLKPQHIGNDNGDRLSDDEEFGTKLVR